MVSTDIQAAFIEAQKAEPELFGIDERALYQKLRLSNRLPSPTDNRLRLAFWVEYDRAQALAESMKMQNIFAGIATSGLFYNQYIRSPSRVAWLLTPPVSYVVKTAEALDFGLDRLRDILEREPVDAKGKFDVRLAELQAKITWMLEQRVKGAVVTKIEQKTFGLNVHTSDKAVAQMAMGDTMESLEKRLKDLEKKERQTMSLPVSEKGRESVTVEAVVADGES